MKANSINKAYLVANTAHTAAEQYRKFTGEPYIVHPVRVAEITETLFEEFESVGGSYDDILCAAYLHDTVEDTGLTIDFIEKEFGTNVAGLVDSLTSEKSYCLSRSQQLDAYILKLQVANAGAVVVKLADIMANFEDVKQSHNQSDHKKKFKNWKRFIDEKRKIINSLWIADSKSAQALLNDMAWFESNMIEV